jgi:4-hydroxy-tetrahydrodipicolinate synthase
MMRGGIWAAVVTPVTPEFQIDLERAIEYYRSLLERGCDGVAILGTTGEAMSFSVGQRRALMEAVARALDVERVVCGTGAASLDDAAALTQLAVDLDFAGAMVLPPFFFRDAADAGVARFYDALAERVRGNPRLLLYNFPKMSGVTLSADLVSRISRSHPGAVIGIKESSNDRALQREVRRRLPGLHVFPGSEAHLVEALTEGAAGCISGSVALWPELAAEVAASRDAGKAARLTRMRQELEGARLIPQVRERIALERGDDAWNRSVPPL